MADERVIIWFDIDNTLYSASSKISHAMGERIHGELGNLCIHTLFSDHWFQRTS